MKILSIISLSIFLLLGCNQTKSNDTNKTAELKSKSEEIVPVLLTDTTFTFDNSELGKLPSGWSQYYTGVSDTTDWKIVDDNGNRKYR